MSASEKRVCEGGCGRDLDAIHPPLRKGATVCRDAKCRRAAQRSCKRKGHQYLRGECGRCGKYCLPPRASWRDKRARSRGRSPGIDLPHNWDGPSNARSRAGELFVDHALGPADDDIFTLTTVGEGRPRPAVWGERPLCLKDDPPNPSTIDERRPDWRLIYARAVVRGELTIEGARRKIASIEAERKAAQRRASAPNRQATVNRQIESIGHVGAEARDAARELRPIELEKAA